LKGYSAHVETIDDITKNFNSHLVNKLFIYGDEIKASSKCISDKLKQRFIKDYSLHINTHIEPYFSYQLNLFGNTKEYELLIDAINTLGSEDEFFNENKRNPSRG
jgi:hypothetical protein